MKKIMWKVSGLLGVCMVLSFGTPEPAWADSAPVETSTSLYVMPYESLPVRESAGITGKVIEKAAQGGGSAMKRPVRVTWCFMERPEELIT